MLENGLIAFALGDEMPEVGASPQGFAKCQPYILKIEGGKNDDPQDPGGRTNQGITQRVYDAYRRRRGRQAQDVYLMGPAERDDIYLTQYWNAIRGDDLPDGVNLVVYDGSVNSGPSQSVKWLQRALAVDDDGAIGEMTLDALQQNQDHDELINRIIDQREAFVRKLNTFKRYGNGWISRCNYIESVGQQWASGSIGPPIIGEAQAQAMRNDGATAKAHIDDVKKAPPIAPADASTGLGIGSGGIAATLQTLQNQLTPYSLAGDWIGKVVVVLAIAAAVLTIGGLAWRWYASRKRQKIAEAM